MLVLFTDFGIGSPYVGQMKLAIWHQAPQLPIIDLLHDAPPYDSQAAAYLLAAFTADLPEQCAVVGVIDPGVGSARDGLIIKADERWYVGPDNGLFDRIAAQAEQLQCWRLTWQPERLSASFHGRDIFAPVAACLVTGKNQPEQLGETIEYRWQNWPEQLARIIYIDTYGNVMTGLQACNLSDSACLQAEQYKLMHARTFAAVPRGQAFWYENSSGLVEIAVNQGRADQQLGLQVGSTVTVLLE